MMKQYLVKYWTKDMKITSIIVGAYNALDAREIAESYPNFGTLMTYPEEVKQ